MSVQVRYSQDDKIKKVADYPAKYSIPEIPQYNLRVGFSINYVDQSLKRFSYEQGITECRYHSVHTKVEAEH